MRKGRIWSWIICLIIAGLLIASEGWYKEATTEKSPLYVYAPEDMEYAFRKAHKSSELKRNYAIVMTDDKSKANIVIETDEEFDPRYIQYARIAYSPFVVAYGNQKDNIKKMVEIGLLKDAFFNNEYKEINFNKVIEEVLGEGKWENLGVKDMETIKVFYPAPDTQYYSAYYDFMLVTVNGGLYPKSEEELRIAKKQIESFENSNYTEAIRNFEEKFDRTGGFQENILYLLPEQLALTLTNDKAKTGRLFYPTTTVYVNFYSKADELGAKLVNAFEKQDFWGENFYSRISGYRSSCVNLIGSWDYMQDERDVFNVLDLEEDRIRPDDISEVNEDTQPVS